MKRKRYTEAQILGFLKEAQLQARIIELTQERRRFGCRRVHAIHALLRRESHGINQKRPYRVYREANLAVRQRKKRHGVAVPREPLLLREKRNAAWSMDFISDALSSGRRLKVLAIVDDCTKTGGPGRRQQYLWP